MLLSSWTTTSIELESLEFLQPRQEGTTEIPGTQLDFPVRLLWSWCFILATETLTKIENRYQAVGTDLTMCFGEDCGRTLELRKAIECWESMSSCGNRENKLRAVWTTAA
ncbi:hypothetical protein STEG23_020797 [Scotinomys teguina]